MPGVCWFPRVVNQLLNRHKCRYSRVLHQTRVGKVEENYSPLPLVTYPFVLFFSGSPLLLPSSDECALASPGHQRAPHPYRGQRRVPLWPPQPPASRAARHALSTPRKLWSANHPALCSRPFPSTVLGEPHGPARSPLPSHRALASSLASHARSRHGPDTSPFLAVVVCAAGSYHGPVVPKKER